MNGYDDKISISYLAEAIHYDEREFVERNPANYDVRLTKLGRDNCDKGIEIPPSENQIRPEMFYHS